MKPTILFEDQHLIVLSKPAGLLSQGEKTGDENLVDWLRLYLGRKYVGLVHRLDRNTSGLMVVAKRSKAASRLSQALRQGSLERSYLAWLLGKLESSQIWRHQLRKDRRNNFTAVVSQGSDAELTVIPKRQITWHGMALTLAQLTLRTGKSHQIRVQAAFEGYPLLGDVKYHPKGPTFPRLALHSCRLQFPHPMTHEPLNWEEGLPAELNLD